LIYLGPPFSTALAALIIIGIIIEWTLLSFKLNLPLLKKLLFIVCGTVYLSLSIYFLFLYFLLPDGWMYLFWLFILVWSIDIFAFVGGSILRGPKLSPSISPNKTWAGFISGILAGVGMGYAASLWLLPGSHSWVGLFFLSLVAQFGDLLESKAKRLANIKDSSPLIPGHGGLLDRLDSLIGVGFVLALWHYYQTL
jgi:phosphatidate cytidylyltransferase